MIVIPQFDGHADFNLTGSYFANTAEGTSNFNINNPNIEIGGTVTLISTDTANIDDLNTAAGLTIGGDLTVNFEGGTNMPISSARLMVAAWTTRAEAVLTR